MDFTQTIRKKEKTRQPIAAVFAFLLAVSPLGGLCPFGHALLCASPKRLRRSVFIGVLVGSLLDSPIWLSAFCTVFIYFVLTAKEKQSGVFLYNRILLSFAVATLRVAWVALQGVTDMTAVFRIFAAMTATPIFTVAFHGYFDRKNELHPRRRDIALLAFAFAFTALLTPFSVGGVSLALIPAAAFTLCAARTHGFSFGGVCGVLCGIVSGGAATGALGVMGLSYGMLAGELEPLALALSFMISVCGYFYLSGTAGTVPAMIMTAIVFAVFIPLRKKLSIHRSTDSISEKRLQDKRFAKVASAFSSLSSLFYTVSNSTRADNVTELNKGIVSVVDRHCERCAGCGLDKSEITNFFTTEIRSFGVTKYSRIPSYITSFCPNSATMAREINGLSVLREQESEKGLKSMGDEFSAISSLLIEAAKRQEDSVKPDRVAAEKLKSTLLAAGVVCDGVRVTGERQREITAYGVQPDKIKRTPAELARAVSAAVGTSVTEPELILHDDYTLMRFATAPAIRIEFAKISEAKSGETVCGDTVSVFENDESYFYCLVSDGMGSGRDAALTSRLSAIMLEKLLSIGTKKESALKLLNKALLEKNSEVFATVDLLEIDRISGRATLLKAGAAPTVLIRGGRWKVLEARTPPAGIMKKVIADKKTFTLEKGDMIVMLSDGILQTGSEFRLLPEHIPPLPTARAMATKILRESKRNCEASDDRSVCVLRIY